MSKTVNSLLTMQGDFLFLKQLIFTHDFLSTEAGQGSRSLSRMEKKELYCTGTVIS